MRYSAVVVLLTAVVSVASAAQVPVEVDVPVQRVVLFSSGVGYFEHYGTVSGDATVQLSFRTEQINDVLKSMVLMDFDGGTARSVSYSPREPLMRALKSFAIDLSGDPSMGQLLTQLRGVDVELLVPELIQGKVLGVETKRREIIDGGKTTILTEPVLNLVVDGGIRSIPIGTIQNIELVDEGLAEELQRALALLAESHDTQKKPVEIHFAGTGERRVAVNYVTETPVWKTSYRLILDGQSPRLQGWAIVENTTDADWEAVNLELISGRPISFVQDLYTPLYLDRPVVKPKLYASLRPRLYEEAMEPKAESAAREARARKLRRRAPQSDESALAMAGVQFDASAKRAVVARELAKGVEAYAGATQVGELFRYSIELPVTLPRRRSAMLPIISSSVQADRVSIYNERVQAAHPLNGVWLTNDTKMLLPSGPVTVFDEAYYAGDAQIDNMPAGDRRLLSYAVDLKVLVDPSVSSTSRVFSGSINRGVLLIGHRRLWEKTYKIKNKADDERWLIIEHPRDASRTLLEPTEPAETTPSLYRFEVAVRPGETSKFKVATEQIYSESIGILDGRIDVLLRYAKTGQISQAVREALAPALRMRQEISVMAAELADLTKRRGEIGGDQGRLRDNIRTVGRPSTLGKRYQAKLNEQEDEMDRIEVALRDIRAAIEAKKAQLGDYLKELKVD